MPWTCPACSSIIRHSDFEEQPRPGVHYRCHVCRLDLIMDPPTMKLTALLLGDEHRNPGKRRDP